LGGGKGGGHREDPNDPQGNGTAVNVAQSNGATPLLIAAQNGHRDVVALLLDKGAAVNQMRIDGGTALIIAAQNGHRDIVKLLLEKGAAVNQAMQDGATPLLITAQNGHRDVMELLLDKGAAVNQAMSDGRTPLHAAAYFGHRDIVTLLLKYSADKSTEVTMGSLRGSRPVDLARQQGHTAVIALLEDGQTAKQEHLQAKEAGAKSQIRTQKGTMSAVATVESGELSYGPNGRIYSRVIFTRDYIVLGKAAGKGFKVSSGMTMAEFEDAAKSAGASYNKIGVSAIKVGEETFHFKSGKLNELEN